MEHNKIQQPFLHLQDLNDIQLKLVTISFASEDN